jgi:hypothetical protein
MNILVCTFSGPDTFCIQIPGAGEQWEKPKFKMTPFLHFESDFLLFNFGLSISLRLIYFSVLLYDEA